MNKIDNIQKMKEIKEHIEYKEHNDNARKPNKIK